VGTNSNYQFGTTSPTSGGGITESRQGNPDLRWETAIKRNIGLDLGLFNNNLTVTVDVFDEKRKDILMQARSFPLIQGGPVPTVNIGKVNNKG
jgi:outer membrane receptor protein involved in Fe transport